MQSAEPDQIDWPRGAQLKPVLDAALAIAGASKGTLQLAEGRALRLCGSRGFDAPFLSFFDLVRDNECACGSALASGSELVVPDVMTSDAFVGKPSLQVVLDAGVRSVACLPIVARSGFAGMISVHRPAPTREAEYDMHRLRWLAREAAKLLDGTLSFMAERAIAVLARGAPEGH
jgi:GAF domain-containing protein